MKASHRRSSTRRPRDRAATQAALLTAARTLIEREGVLAGVTLSAVADEAGVNRGQIYQYFGTRRDLLREALASMSYERGQSAESFDTPFRTRRQVVFEKALERSAEIRLDALLALDGDTDLGLFPVYDEAIAAWRRDVDNGHLPRDADVELLHVLTASTYLGYVVFREAMAAETGIDADDLDERAQRAFARVLDSLTRHAPSTEGEGS